MVVGLVRPALPSADAARIHRHLRSLPEQADVLLVGGGLTGVEVAAQIASQFGERQRITIVEAGSHLLPGLPAAIQRRARRRLGWLGVNVVTGAPVTRLAGGQVYLAGGDMLTASLIIWAAGVKGHPLAAHLGVSVDRTGRVPVDLYLRTHLPGVYVLGDSAAFHPCPDRPPLPPSAELAEQMGFAAAADLADRLRGGPGVPFRPRVRGVLCELGRWNASGIVYRLPVHGLLGAAAKRASVLGHLCRTMGPRGVLHLLRRRSRGQEG